ncbi:1637_t:CDS:2 [Ambispora gerdemannii]|uniref:1637_t:CDS:1 n=1 Tax=Ambispora gerdemannii TaxID=144530 RepID=A0A9N9D4W0_9GLOM|nr:1637_t:CDS:2 [Ambispora gerdemannii]
MRYPAFLSRFSRWSSFLSRLAGRSKYQNYQLPPEFGRPSDTETWDEISAKFLLLCKIYSSSYVSARFAKRSGEICNPQRLGSLFAPARQMNTTVKGYSTKNSNNEYEPKWIELDLFIEMHKSIMEASLFRMAAGLGESIIKNHAFLDGNKRAGNLAINMFLLLNGYELVSSEKILIGVATGDIDLDMLESWIANNVKAKNK